MSFFQKLKSGLSRTKEAIVTRVENIVRRAVKVDENFWEEIEETLILSDVGMNMAVSLTSRMRERYRVEKPGDMDGLMALMRSVMAEMLVPEEQPSPLDFPPGLNVVMITGVNGSGKTTSIGKLAFYFSALGKKVMLAACDTFRAAAVDQLNIWAERSRVPIIMQKEGTDPSAVMFDAVQSARARNIDILIVDTAGRLHTKNNLMEELKKLKRVAVEKAEASSFRNWLVLDSTLGQNSLNQVKVFNDVAPVDALVITKLDGTAKGGIVFSIIGEMKVPIAFVGVGEKMEDLMPFDPGEFSKALLGDMSASENISEETVQQD